MIKDLNSLRLQEIGAIKIGGKGEKKTSQQGKEFRLPQKYDHFIVTTKQRNAAGDFLVDMEIHKKIGNEPREIKIRLLYDDINLDFDTNYVYYHGKTCLCRGDGQFAIRRLKDGKMTEIACDREKCEFALPDAGNNGSRRCKAFGRLQCIMDETNIIGGVHIFRTTSWNTIVNIISSLKFIQSVTGGMLAGIPLKLTIQPKTVTPENTNITTTIYVVNIIFAGTPQMLLETTIDIAKRRMVAGVELRQIQEQAKKGEGFLLKDHFKETEEEIQDISDEFYPEIVEEDKPDFLQESNITEKKNISGSNADRPKNKTKEAVDIFEGMNIL